MFTRLACTILAVFCATQTAAFCGFYVARANGELFNEASKVIFMRDRNRSTITMSSDYQGAPKDFAMIVPTPKVLKRSEVRTVDAKTIDHLDNYTAPRLVEYHDQNPCYEYDEILEDEPEIEDIEIEEDEIVEVPDVIEEEVVDTPPPPPPEPLTPAVPFVP